MRECLTPEALTQVFPGAERLGSRGLAGAGAADASLDVPLGKADDLYVDLHTALPTPPAIGGNLIGLERFNEYMRRMPGASVIVVASSGPYDFLGENYHQAAQGYRFDRIRVVQGGRTFTFVDDQAGRRAGHDHGCG